MGLVDEQIGGERFADFCIVHLGLGDVAIVEATGARLGQVFVNFSVGREVAIGGDGVERVEQAVKVEPGHGLDVGLGPTARFDKHGGDAERLDAIAEGAWFVRVVVTGDHAFGVRPHGLDEDGTHLFGGLHGGRYFARGIWRGGEHRNGGGQGRAADRGAGVLVVQIEAELRLECFSGAKQRAAFGRGEASPVAVDIDALGVEALVALGTVGVEHGDHEQRAVREDLLGQRLGWRLQQVTHEVEQHGGVRGLIAVHLRPEEDALGAGAERCQIDGAFFERF